MPSLLRSHHGKGVAALLGVFVLALATVKLHSMGYVQVVRPERTPPEKQPMLRLLSAAAIAALALAQKPTGGTKKPSGGGKKPVASQDYHLDVELYIFGQETKVAYGGTCENACTAAPIASNGNGDSQAVCPAGCTYTAYVAAVPYQPAKNVTTATTTVPEVKAKPDVKESCAQKTTFDCSTVEGSIDCPAGLCDPKPCVGVPGCKFTPVWEFIPQGSIKYNIGSKLWPFCGPDNWLSVVVELKEGKGQEQGGETCTAPACKTENCTDLESALIDACQSADLSNSTSASA
eukprot:COSAG01_NODE_9092_length_2559_cov_7.257724_5_plen_289_part_01